MSVHDGVDVPYGSLKLLSKIGDGGQGEVHAIGGPGKLLYKSYREPHKVDGAALADLVSLRQELDPADRDRLDREMAWPLCRVTDGSRVTGFLMHRAPAVMTWTTSKGDSKLVELSYLLRPRRPRGSRSGSRPRWIGTRSLSCWWNSSGGCTRRAW